MWHTLFGSNWRNWGTGITVSNDRIYITGWSESSWSGPDGEKPHHAYIGNRNIYILNLGVDGSYKWHTFYGSSSAVNGNSIVLEDDRAYVIGKSWNKWSGPNGEEPLHAYSGGDDIFVLKLGVEQPAQTTVTVPLSPAAKLMLLLSLLSVGAAFAGRKAA